MPISRRAGRVVVDPVAGWASTDRGGWDDGGMSRLRYTTYIEKHLDSAYGAYDGDGLLRYDDPKRMVLSAWDVQFHVDFITAFHTHGDRTFAGLRATMTMLGRRGWRMAKRVKAKRKPKKAASGKAKATRSKQPTVTKRDRALITGWPSTDMALDKEFARAWLSPAHAGMAARLDGGEPVLDPADHPGVTLVFSRVRPATYRPERLHAAVTTREFTVVTATPIALFGDQDEATRSAVAAVLVRRRRVNARWQPVIDAYAAGRPAALPPLVLPHGEWTKAITRMVGLHGIASTALPTVAETLDSIAARHEALAKRIAGGLQQDAALRPEKRKVRDAILRHGGHDPRALGPAGRHEAMAEEARILARSVRLFCHQRP